MMRPIVLLLMLGLVVCAAFLSGCVSSPAPEAAGDKTPRTPAGADELMFITEEYPPFNYVENGTIRGISVDMLLGVFQQMDSTISSDYISVLPWSKAYETALTHNNTAVFATVRLPEREHLFKWAGPLGSERKVIFSHRDNPPLINSPGDLSGYRIGVVKDDAAYLQLQALGVNRSKIIAISSVPLLITAMQEGTIDLWCYGETAGRYFAGKVTGDPGYFDVAYTLDTEDLYYAFNRNTSDQVIEDFQAALDTLRYEPGPSGVTEYQRIVYRYVGVSCMPHPPVTKDKLMGLVNLTAEAMEKDAPGTIARINAGEHPFWDRENRALYIFVYDPGVTIVAEADNPRLVGVNMKGKTDVAGTPFRDQITKRALAEGTGWVDYIWMVPEENGVYHKSAFFRLVGGSDSRPYIVASGMYTPCTPGT